ncbi:MAG TPA: formylmethanofuran dehydrogenase subunit C [Conexibacter sp.]
MTLTLTLREAPAAPVDARALSVDGLAGLGRAEVERVELWHGNRRAPVGELFAVAGSPSDELRLEGDLAAVHGIGVRMSAGRLVVAGNAGAHTGAQMRGGELFVEGDTGDWTGAEMSGGLVVVRGSGGSGLGAGYPGPRAGMRGGEIIVHGDAGAGPAAGLRRGLVAVVGRAGAHAGFRMLAGTFVALGAVGAHPGADMRRGTIVAMSAPRFLPTFSFACTYRPPHLALVLRRLAELGAPIRAAHLEGRYRRYSGDMLDLGRGEILVLEDGT